MMEGEFNLVSMLSELWWNEWKDNSLCCHGKMVTKLLKEIMQLCYGLCTNGNESIKRQLWLMLMNLEDGNVLWTCMLKVRRIG